MTLNEKEKVIVVFVVLSIAFSGAAFYISLTYPNIHNNSLEQLVDSQQQLLQSQQQWLGTVSNSTTQLYGMYDNLQSQISFLVDNLNTSQGNTILPVSNKVPDFAITFINSSVNATGFSLTASYFNIIVYQNCITLFSLDNFTLIHTYQSGNHSYSMIVDGRNVTSSFSGTLNFTRVDSDTMTSFEGIFRANISANNFFVMLNDNFSFSAQHLNVIYIDENHWLINATNCDLSLGGANIEFNGNIIGGCFGGN